MLTFKEKKLLKDLLSTCDAFYRTKDIMSCVNSLHNLLSKKSYEEIKPILETEYHNALIFPFQPHSDEPDFSSYCNLNKRMGENMDWHCNDGGILECLQ